MNVLRAETHKFHFCLGLAQREPTSPTPIGHHKAKETTNEKRFLQSPKNENIGLLDYWFMKILKNIRSKRPRTHNE
jgi:hypothetical protein